MKPKIKKRGQKIVKRIERFSSRAKKGGEQHIREKLIARLPNARQVRVFILEWGLLVLAIISLAITQAFWYSSSYSAEAYVAGGTYIEGTTGEVKSLNPLFATTSSEKVLSRLMFATLTTVDYSGHIGMGLAASVRPDDTGETWTLTLRDGLTWSDGAPITLDDVLFTVQLIQDPTLNTIYSSNLSGVQVEQVDQTIVFHLPSAYADFATALNFPLLPAHLLASVPASQLLEHAFSTQPTTSGAFTFNATQNLTADGERLIYLTSNPRYFRGQPLLDTFAVHTYPETADLVTALATGEITATAELSAADAAALPMSQLNQRQTAISNGVFAFLNTASSALSSTSVRQAIRQGINLETVRSVLDGEAPLDYPILGSEIELDSYPELPAYDPEAARSALASAGLADQTLSLVTINSGYFPELASALERELESLGLTVEVSIYDPGQDFLLNIIRPRSYDILLYEVELGADPDLFAYYYSSQASASGLNLSNYRNSLADDLILGARSTLDHSLRVAKYESFLREWVDDVPAIGLYQSNLTYFYAQNVRTFSEDNRLVYATDRFTDVESWAVVRATRNRTP